MNEVDSIDLEYNKQFGKRYIFSIHRDYKEYGKNGPAHYAETIPSDASQYTEEDMYLSIPAEQYYTKVLVSDQSHGLTIYIPNIPKKFREKLLAIVFDSLKNEFNFQSFPNITIEVINISKGRLEEVLMYTSGELSELMKHERHKEFFSKSSGLLRSD